MLSDFNIKSCLLLFGLSLLAIVALHLGFADISLSISQGKAVNTISQAKGGNIESQITRTDGHSSTRCTLISIRAYDYCGIKIGLGEKNPTQGIDLRSYDRIELSLRYSAPLKSAKIKVMLRNYNAIYSTKDDALSLKFNSIAFNPNTHQGVVSVPLNAFQVDNWWASLYSISFENSR